MLKKLSKYVLFASILGAIAFTNAQPKNTNNVYIGAYRTSGIVNLVNTQRKVNNLPNFVYSKRLSSAAYKRAVSLYNNDQWSHNGFQQAVDSVANSSVLYGENLGVDIPSDGVLISRWMESPSHRANILSNSYRYFGFARYKNYAVLWFSQEY